MLHPPLSVVVALRSIRCPLLEPQGAVCGTWNQRSMIAPYAFAKRLRAPPSGGCFRDRVFSRSSHPGEDLTRLDHDVVAAVDPLDPRRTIAERPVDAGLPQIGRFEQVR